MTVSTYLSMVMKGLLQDKYYIVYMVLLYLVISMVQYFIHKQIECKNNKHLVQCIYWFTIKKVREIAEILKDRNWVHTFRLWYSYDLLTMNRPYIILLCRPIKR